MRKSLIYYMGIIESKYPKMEKLTIKEYETIAEEINANIKNNTNFAVKKLYNKLLIYFQYIARMYVDKNLPSETFEDALSSLYIDLIESFNKKIKTGKWYANYNTFGVDTHKVLYKFIDKWEIAVSKKVYLKEETALNGNKSYSKATPKDLKSGKYIIKAMKKVQLERVCDENTPDEDFLENLGYKIDTEELNQTLSKVLNTLGPREEQYLRLYFGLDDGKPKTFEEIGKLFNCSRVRAMQIVSKALCKMRHPSRTKYLKDYNV